MANILVIEDDVLLLALISSALGQDRHTIIETKGPVEAMEIIKRRNEGIDLILTDVAMTPISGLVLASRLTKQGINIPVLFMSGYHSIVGPITASLGTDALIEKPFTANGLRKAVRAFLGRGEQNPSATPAEPSIVRNDLRAKLPAPIRTLFRN